MLVYCLSLLPSFFDTKVSRLREKQCIYLIVGATVPHDRKTKAAHHITPTIGKQREGYMKASVQLVFFRLLNVVQVSLPKDLLHL